MTSLTDMRLRVMQRVPQIQSRRETRRRLLRTVGAPCTEREIHGLCGRCRQPWCRVEHHVTNYGRNGLLNDGLFPLCEGCWLALKTAEARLPYYRILVDFWGYDAQRTKDIWDMVVLAVNKESSLDAPHSP